MRKYGKKAESIEGRLIGNNLKLCEKYVPLVRSKQSPWLRPEERKRLSRSFLQDLLVCARDDTWIKNVRCSDKRDSSQRYLNWFALGIFFKIFCFLLNHEWRRFIEIVCRAAVRKNDWILFILFFYALRSVVTARRRDRCCKPFLKWTSDRDYFAKPRNLIITFQIWAIGDDTKLRDPTFVIAGIKISMFNVDSLFTQDFKNYFRTSNLLPFFHSFYFSLLFLSVTQMSSLKSSNERNKYFFE